MERGKGSSNPQKMERGEGSSNPQKSDGLNDTRIIGQRRLKLAITPNMIKLVEKTSANETALREEFPPDLKSKASNVHALSITIGNWHNVAEHNGGVVAKCYFAKKKLVWEVLIDAMQKKFEFMWDTITAIRATFDDEQTNTLQVELAKPPLYFAECAPQPRKNTTWESCTDFTDGQARAHRIHTLTFVADGKFEKFYQKLIHFTRDLYLASRRSFDLDSPFFERVDRPSSPLRNYDTNGLLPQHNPDMNVLFTDPSSVNCYQSTAADANAAMMHGGISLDPALLVIIDQQQAALNQNNFPVQPQPQPQPQAPIYHIMPISAKPLLPPDEVAQVAQGFNWTGDDEQYYLGSGDPSSLMASASEGFNMDENYYGEEGMNHTMYSPQTGAAGFSSGSADLAHLIAAQVADDGYAAIPQMMAPDYYYYYYSRSPLLQASNNGGFLPPPPPPPMVQSNYSGGPLLTGYQMPPPGNDDYKLPPLPNQLNFRLPRYQ